MPNYYTPFQGNPYMNKIDENQFNNWRGQYYGNNDYGYQPQQNRLSDLVQPQSFQYTNANFTPQYQAPQYQAPQFQPQYAPQNGPAQLRNLRNVYIDNAGDYMTSGDYVSSENMRTNNMDTRGLYDTAATYYRRMGR